MFPADTVFLVVDDMVTMRKIVVKTVKDLGYKNFLEASDGKQAWETLQANPKITCVISDWNMPNMTGLEFLKKVRADARFKNLPFLMVTAETEQSQIVDAIKSEVSNYVVKPFTPNAIKEKLLLCFKKHNPQVKAA